MSTATAIRAPSEGEIREALLSRKFLREKLMDAIVEASRPVGDPAVWAGAEPAELAQRPDPQSGALWWDLRPTQAARLNELAEAAMERAADQCEQIILDELTAAGLTLAQEFPDAPRPADG